MVSHLETEIREQPNVLQRLLEEERTNINEVCPNCGIDTVLCSVCKLPISFGSEHLECYHCQNVAHKEHLLEWVKVKGTCPVCQQKLVADKLAVAEEKE